MRPFLLTASAALVLAGAGSVGWIALHRGDPVAQARLLTQRHDLHGAELVLRNLLRQHPERADAHLRLAQLQLRLGDAFGAEHELRQALAHGADEHAVRPLLAQALVAQGHGDDVLRSFNADGLDPGQAAGLHMARALAAVSAKQPVLARREADAAQQAAPHSVDVALNGARVAAATGDPDGAARLVDRALLIDPHAGAALALRAQVLAQRGDRAGAIAAYGAVLSDPLSGQGEILSARLARAQLFLAESKDDDARADLLPVLKASPRNPLANYLAALLDIRGGRWKQADETLAQVGTALEQFKRGDVLLAIVDANVGKPQGALDAAERFNLHNPDDRAGVLLLARLYLMQRQPAQVTALLAAWNVPGRSGPDILSLLSQSYAMSGQAGAADATLRQAITPDDPRALVRLADVAAREGDNGLAAEALQHALDAPARTGASGGSGGAPAPGTAASLAQGSAAASPSQGDTAAALVLTLLKAGQPDRAAAVLARLRQMPGEAERSDLLDGRIRLAAFDLAGARSAFDRAHARDPGSRDAVVALTEVMQLQGDGAGATALLRQAIDGRPTDKTLLAALVGLSTARHAPADAMPALEAAHAAAPDDAYAAIALAELYLRTGQPAKGLAVADAMPADSVQHAVLRAEAEHALGRQDAALADWRGLLAKAPGNVALRRRVVGTLLADKRYDAALSILEEGLAAHPDDLGLQGDAVTLAAARNGLDAGLARADGFAAHAADPGARLLKGDLLLRSGRFNDAAQFFAASRTGLPQDADPGLAETLLLRQADALSRGGNAAGATALLQDWQTGHPDRPAVLDALAETRIAGGALGAARGNLQAALKVRPDDVVALNNLAWIEQRQGDFADARAHATAAYRIAPTPQVADTLGAVLLAGGGRGADALALLREASAGLPRDPSVQFHLAEALKQDGKLDDARTVLRPVLDDATPFDERTQAQRLMQSLGKS